jgi:hypothetical protein
MELIAEGNALVLLRRGKALEWRDRISRLDEERRP